MDLILWRHAEAEDGIPDTTRKLTKKGLSQAQHMADWLRSKLPEKVQIIVSPTTRTQQTAKALQAEFVTEKSIGPGASVDAILVAANWPVAETAILIVGHQPTIGEVVSYLVPVIPNGLRVKKGSVWWLRSQLQGDTVTVKLHRVIYPEDL